MRLPEELVNKIQYDFVGDKYNKGIFIVPTLKEEDINLVISSFIKWCEGKDLITSGLLNITSFFPPEEKTKGK